MTRSDRIGSNRTQFEKAARYIYRTQEICGICGLPVDKSLKSPDPMSKTVDHIIPVSKGGHPFDLDNLQLAHRCCNRQKGTRLFIEPGTNRPLKNTPGVQNNPRGIKLPAGAKNSGANESPGALPATVTGNDSDALDQVPELNNPDSSNNWEGLKEQAAHAAVQQTNHINNRELPQHVDWTTLEW